MTDQPKTDNLDEVPLGTDYSEAGARVLQRYGALAGTNANANPDEAARSVQLGIATGIPSNVIHIDPKGFEERLKQQVVQGIVSGNPSLAQYAGSDPMASKVSNDDWAHLHTLSGMLHSLREASDALTQPFQKAITEGAEGFKEGIGTEPLTSLEDVARQRQPKTMQDFINVGAEALGTNVLESVMRVGSGVFGGLSGAAGGLTKGFTGSEGLGRDVKAMTEYEMLKPEQMPGGPWLMAGHEPPAGISKDLDKSKVERNETLLKGLEDVTSLVQQSKTWERSPELFKKFVEQHLGDRTISIAGDAVTALYGDKVPAPNDGLLGLVPNIGSQVLAAHVDGSDVVVPLGDWLAHMDPAVAKGLHDNVRMFPEGVTRAESTVERPQVPPPQVMTKATLVPAAKLPDGTVRSGRLGQVHGDLFNEEEMYGKEGEDKALIDGAEMGFTTPDGTFLDRKQAMKYVEANEPHLGEPGGKLEALGYFKKSQAVADSANTINQVRAAGGLEPVFRADPKAESVGAAKSDHPMIIGLDTIDPKAVGLPEGHWQKLQELAQVQYEEDMSIAQRRAERQQKREQTAEWKANRAEVLEEVEADTRAMPHVAADLFIGSGELDGEKLQQRFTLREADLTPEQKATLPDHYVSKNGFGIDDVATHFGFGSGDALVEALAWHHSLKAGRSPTEMLRDMVKAETDHRMEQKYGDLPNNILTAAHDQALSDTTLNLVTQEYQGALMSAEAKGFKGDVIRPELVKDEAKRIADEVLNKDVDSKKKLAEVSRHYSDAVKGLLGNDPQLAIMALQRRAIGAHVAKELMAREEAMKKFAKLADSYAGRWDPTKALGQKIVPEWSLMIRNILGKLGLKNGMTPAWMAQEMANSRFTGLADFVEKVEKESALVELHLPIPDFLYEDKVKPLKEMTGDEFRAAADAVTMMDHIGRADQKADVNGKKVEKDQWVAQAVAQLEKKFPALPSDRKVGPAGTLAAASTSAETLFQRFDGRDPHGLFTRTFIYPMAEKENFKNRVERETAGEYQKLGEIRDKDKLLESPIIDPSTGKPWAGFTRKHLHAVISNMGNEYNWKIACKGWGVDPDLMWKWVESVTDADDIRRGQGLSNIFGGIKPRIDTVDRNVYGVASESVVPRPFTMHGEQFDGWYHPIIPNKALSRYVNKLPELKETQGEFWPSVYNKFLKKRTGAVQFIDLTYDAIPSRLMQQIHYLAMHEPVMNVARLIRDDRFRRAVTTHYGKEYMEAIDHWVQSAAGEASVNSGMMAQATKWSGIMRQNVMNTMIGFNMGTVEKHGPTAFMYSLKELAPKTVVAGIPSFLHVTAEVAPGLFKHTVMDLFGRSPELGDSWFDFVLKHSEEIRRRVRNYQDTLLGTQQTFESGRSLRNVIFEYGAKPVAFSDMLSAAPLWLARYRQEMALHGDFGLAIQAADLSVRRAHGSTAVTSRPMIATGNNPVTPWFTSLYGFMGTSLNRRIELLHDVNDAYRLGMGGDIKAAAKMLPQIASSFAVYVVWTGVVEELVTGQFTEDHRGPIEKSASFLFTSLANAIIGLRDFNNSIERGGGSVGLLSTPPADVARVLRDVKIDKTMEGKYNPLAKQNAGKLVQDTCTLIGDFSGYCPKHVGAVIRYGMDAYDGMQKPKDATDVYHGLMTGTQKLYQRR